MPLSLYQSRNKWPFGDRHVLWEFLSANSFWVPALVASMCGHDLLWGRGKVSLSCVVIRYPIVASSCPTGQRATVAPGALYLAICECSPVNISYPFISDSHGLTHASRHAFVFCFVLLLFWDRFSLRSPGSWNSKAGVHTLEKSGLCFDSHRGKQSSSCHVDCECGLPLMRALSSVTNSEQDHIY